MTTHDPEIVVEEAGAWPKFAGNDVADVLIVSQVCRRRADETLAEVAKRAARLLLAEPSVQHVLAGREVTLIGRSEPAVFHSRFALIRTRRAGLWMTFDDDELPAGRRFEAFVDGGEEGHFVGYIAVPQSDIERAILFTRTHLALCVAARSPHAGTPLLEALAGCTSKPAFLTTAAGLVANGFAVLSSWGLFDDVEISADLFVSRADWELALAD